MNLLGKFVLGFFYAAGSVQFQESVLLGVQLQQLLVVLGVALTLHPHSHPVIARLSCGSAGSVPVTSIQG